MTLPNKPIFIFNAQHIMHKINLIFVMPEVEDMKIYSRVLEVILSTTPRWSRILLGLQGFLPRRLIRGG